MNERLEGTFERVVYKLLSRPYTPKKGVHVRDGKAHVFHHSAHLLPTGRKLDRLVRIRHQVRAAHYDVSE